MLLLCIPSLPICLSLSAPAVLLPRSCPPPWVPVLSLRPPNPGTGGGVFVGCCLWGGLGLTQEVGKGEERAGWDVWGRILHRCKSGWGQSCTGFCGRPQWMGAKPPKALAEQNALGKAPKPPAWRGAADILGAGSPLSSAPGSVPSWEGVRMGHALLERPQSSGGSCGTAAGGGGGRVMVLRIVPG